MGICTWWWIMDRNSLSNILKRQSWATCVVSKRAYPLDLNIMKCLKPNICNTYLKFNIYESITNSIKSFFCFKCLRLKKVVQKKEILENFEHIISHVKITKRYKKSRKENARQSRKTSCDFLLVQHFLRPAFSEFKVGLWPSKKICFTYFRWKPFENYEKCF